jgi:hypothetical protein
LRAAAAAIVSCLLFLLPVFAVWLNRVITDTDTYASTVAPLASDPAIRNAAATLTRIYR